MEPMLVNKTLVIGLGSTGTRVCNGIIRRLEWEFRSLGRAPWVRFLALETDNNLSTPLRQRGDFLPLGLDARAYAQITEHPETHDNISLRDWADLATLSKVKDTVGGAGNIRMVGRLTFLHEPNFRKVKLALLDRLSALRNLKEAEATAARGKLGDGANPPVEFGSGGQVRVFVVGTLCGGTASGLAPDFGYFLRSVPLREEEQTVGIFTLPHRSLTTATTTRANRLKVNAYHALLELNHYHQARPDELPPIRYPDDTVAPLNRDPYDLPYLVAPTAPTSVAETQLNELVADRVFINIVNPLTDPFSRAIDAPMPDRDHQAHVFSTFGLSVVEFPAQQVAEACSKKLLHGALDVWQRPKPERVTDTVAALGLDWPTLLTSILQRTQDEWQADALRVATEELRQPRPDFERLERALGELRQQVELGGSLTDTLRSRRDHVVGAAYQRFQARASQALRDRTLGPNVLGAEVEHLLQHLQDLHDRADANASAFQTDVAEAWTAVDENVAVLKRELKRKTVLNPNRAGIDAAKRELGKALEAYARLQVEASIFYAVRTHRTYGTIDLGVAEKMQRLLQRVKANLRGLDGRVTALKNKLYTDYDERSRQVPPINGLALFEANSTVQQEFARCLLETRHSAVEDLGNIQARLHDEIVAAWGELPEAVAPPVEQIGDTWLASAFDPRGENLVPSDAYDRMLDLARHPFVSVLATENVLRRLGREMNAKAGAGYEQKVRTAAELARPLAELDPAAARSGNRSPVLERHFLLTPTGTPTDDRDDLRNRVAAAFPLASTELLDSPDRARAMFLVEAYRFPLRGLPQVLGSGGLYEAECHDFPTFHTRRDVYWYGLSQREGKLLADAEEALTLGVILGEITQQDGLTLPWTPAGFGDRGHRRLPANLQQAARMLAKGEGDRDGYSMVGALPTLQSRIEQHWKQPGTNVAESSLRFVKALQDGLQEFYRRYPTPPIAGWGSQRWAGERLITYSAKHKPLHDAYMHLYPPADATINRLRVLKDAAGPWGGVAPEDGLYCPQCGGLVGKDLQDAARNGWRCFVKPTEHYFGPGAAN